MLVASVTLLNQVALVMLVAPLTLAMPALPQSWMWRLCHGATYAGFAAYTHMSAGNRHVGALAESMYRQETLSVYWCSRRKWVVHGAITSRRKMDRMFRVHTPEKAYLHPITNRMPKKFGQTVPASTVL